MSATPAANATTDNRIPVPIIAAAFIAFAALYITSNHAWVIPLITMVVLAATFSEFRFAGNAFAPWVLRMVAFGTIAMVNTGKQNGPDWLFDAKAVNTIGEICAAEFAIQCWRLPAAPMRHRSMLLFLSGLVLLTGCNTFYGTYVRLFTPAFIVCALLSLRAVRPRTLAATTRQAIWGQASMRWAALLVAVIGGATVQQIVDQNRAELTIFGMRLFSQRQWPRMAGISSQPRLGPSFEVQDSPQRVFRIDGPLAENHHLRGMAFDTYHNGMWSPELNGRKSTPLTEQELHGDAEGTRATVTTYIDNHGLVFAPLTLAGLVPMEGSEVEWDARDGGPLRTRDPAPYSYTIIQSEDETHQGMLCPPITPAQRKLCLNVPREISPQVRGLARQITRGAATAPERAEAIAGYLMRNHKYSRRTRRLGGDPVTIFLIERRAAHCEFFASGAVILLRSVGIPARYVVGYYAHEKYGNDSTIVRQRDAHAWAEAWFDEVGWVTIDATPGDGTPDAAPPQPAWRRGMEWVQDKIEYLRDQAANMSREQLLAAACLLASVWLVQTWRVTRRRRALLPGPPAYITPQAEFAALGRRFEAALRRAGAPCPSVTPWHEHLPNLPPGIAAPAEKFVAAYNTARFGHAAHADATSQTTLEAQLLEFETATRARHARNATPSEPP